MSMLKKVREICLRDYTSLGTVTFGQISSLKNFDIQITPHKGRYKNTTLVLNFDFFDQKLCPKIIFKSEKNQPKINHKYCVDDSNFFEVCNNNWGNYTFLIISQIINQK